MTGEIMIDLQPALFDVLPGMSPERPGIIRAAGGALQHARVPPPRDPAIAEQEELEAALRAGTREALELFLARHPEGRFRKDAETALKRISPSR